MKPIYKVVTKNRKSVIREHRGGKYVLEYLEDHRVFAKDGTLGIFCFKRKHQAEEFILGRPNLRIIKVLPIGKGKTPKNICCIPIDRRNCVYSLNSFYKHVFNITEALEGTICYPSVLVLE